jgi:hypothetical protein
LPRRTLLGWPDRPVPRRSLPATFLVSLSAAVLARRGGVRHPTPSGKAFPLRTPRRPAPRRSRTLRAATPAALVATATLVLSLAPADAAFAGKDGGSSIQGIKNKPKKDKPGKPGKLSAEDKLEAKTAKNLAKAAKQKAKWGKLPTETPNTTKWSQWLAKNGYTATRLQEVARTLREQPSEIVTATMISAVKNDTNQGYRNKLFAVTKIGGRVLITELQDSARPEHRGSAPRFRRSSPATQVVDPQQGTFTGSAELQPNLTFLRIHAEPMRVAQHAAHLVRVARPETRGTLTALTRNAYNYEYEATFEFVRKADGAVRVREVRSGSPEHLVGHHGEWEGSERIGRVKDFTLHP